MREITLRSKSVSVAAIVERFTRERGVMRLVETWKEEEEEEGRIR